MSGGRKEAGKKSVLFVQGHVFLTLPHSDHIHLSLFSLTLRLDPRVRSLHLRSQKFDLPAAVNRKRRLFKDRTRSRDSYDFGPAIYQAP